MWLGSFGAAPEPFLTVLKQGVKAAVHKSADIEGRESRSAGDDDKSKRFDVS
jgi:hypothetical protein